MCHCCSFYFPFGSTLGFLPCPLFVFVPFQSLSSLNFWHLPLTECLGQFLTSCMTTWLWLLLRPFLAFPFSLSLSRTLLPRTWVFLPWWNSSGERSWVFVALFQPFFFLNTRSQSSEAMMKPDLKLMLKRMHEAREGVVEPKEIPLS